MKVPKTRYPLAVEKAYARDLKAGVNRLEAITMLVLKSEVKPALNRQIHDSMINDDVIDWLENLIEKFKQLIIGSLTDGDARDMVTRYVNAINSSNRNNVASQIMTHSKNGTVNLTATLAMNTGQPAVLAVNPVAGDAQLQSFVKGKVAENVSYITSIRDDYANKVEQVIYRGVTGGQSYGEMGQAIQHQAHVSRSKASFIARDQSGSIYGQMTKQRHQAAGINKFQWETMEDERVRPSHAAREGVIYDYDTADLLPGEDFNCRCTADPVFDDDE
ncbi:minor capsid protein [Lactiplantibacillus xiangfangensis]|uniref:phage head morphogenesis protein n=1 Tax=Lactiplantibacillus xiangfangensis TaxID=942150 RepID=UPI00384D0613